MKRQRPELGEPCTRCGTCCTDTLCRPAIAVHGIIPGPCPELYFEGDRAFCRLILQEMRDQGTDLIARYLDIGKGCTNYYRRK